MKTQTWMMGIAACLAAEQAHARFLSVDPVPTDPSNGQNFNRYAYANNNPYGNIDPDGRKSCPVGTHICHDSPRTEWGTTTQPGPSKQQKATDNQVRSASRSGRLSDGTKLNLSGSEEQGFSASPNGTAAKNLTGQVCMSCSDGSTRTVATFDASKLQSDESGGHTHPAGIVPLPGPEDGRMAGITGKPAYVISERGAFSIEKTDVGYRVWQIDGRPLNSREAAAVRSTIDDWNQNQGGSGKSCLTGC